LAPVPTDFFPESDELDLLAADEEPLSEELDELDELEEELSPEPEDLADSDLAVESDLSLEPPPLLSDLAGLSAPSPFLLPAATFPFRLSVR